MSKSTASNSVYYVYQLRCQDDTVYTGITTDPSRRMREHFSRGKKCAKYTANHPAKRLEGLWRTQGKSLALRLEYRMKRLSRQDKLRLIAGEELSLIPNIDPSLYERVLPQELLTEPEQVRYCSNEIKLG